MGPQGGDEINLILPGKNYGWPRASNGSHYGGGDIPDHKAGDGFEAPKVWWTPSISPGGLLIYTGDKFPQWKGDALIGALSGEALIRVDIDGDKARKADQWPMGARIRAVDQGPDGSVYLLEDGRERGAAAARDPARPPADTNPAEVVGGCGSPAEVGLHRLPAAREFRAGSLVAATGR